MPRVAPYCQFSSGSTVLPSSIISGTESNHNKNEFRISILFRQLEIHYELLMSFFIFLVFFIISTTLLFAYVLRQHLLVETKSKWSIGFIVISVAVFPLAGMLVCLFESFSSEIWSVDSASVLRRLTQGFWVLGTNCAMCFALFMMLENNQCMLSLPNDYGCDYRAMRKFLKR